jgi:uncharacterized protein YjbI with pentapeptide repeats
MKITTQQIKEIINEELDKLLYEEETDSKLKQALAKAIKKRDVKKYDKRILKQMFAIIDAKLSNVQNPKLKDYLQSDLAKKEPLQTFMFLATADLGFDEKEKKDLNSFEEYFEKGNKEKKQIIANEMVETKDLSGADLRKANLKGVDLSNANLYETNLRSANLEGANLSGANLKWAALEGANLYKADLSNANLEWALVSGATLDAANMTGAKLNGAEFYNISYDPRTQWPKGTIVEP